MRTIYMYIKKHWKNRKRQRKQPSPTKSIFLRLRICEVHQNKTHRMAIWKSKMSKGTRNTLTTVTIFIFQKRAPENNYNVVIGCLRFAWTSAQDRFTTHQWIEIESLILFPVLERFSNWYQGKNCNYNYGFLKVSRILWKFSPKPKIPFFKFCPK